MAEPATEPLTLTECRDEIIRLLWNYRRADVDARTPIARALAAQFVEARSHFARRGDGETDWGGRSYAYRNWVAEVYRQASVEGAEARTAQAAVRYHIGSVLRERLTIEEQRAYGLIEHSPRERSAARRADRAALLRDLTGSGAAECRELLAEAAALLRTARPETHDPGLNRTWGQRRRRLLDQLIQAEVLR